jgi:hypothetical protein
MNKKNGPISEWAANKCTVEPIEMGLKHDTGKQRWHALPLVILEPLADVMQAGTVKYSKFNCLQPFNDSDERFYNGLMRHLEACQLDPLAIDHETGCYHAAQIAFNTLLRLYHARRESMSNLRTKDNEGPPSGEYRKL